MMMMGEVNLYGGVRGKKKSLNIFYFSE